MKDGLIVSLVLTLLVAICWIALVAANKPQPIKPCPGEVVSMVIDKDGCGALHLHDDPARDRERNEEDEMISIRTRSVPAFLTMLAIAIVLVLAIFYGVHMLWCWVMPQVWPTGPETLIAPSFWLFGGAWMLMSIVGRALFGRDSK